MRLSQCTLLLVCTANCSVAALSTSFVILGGTGRIGTAVATHLLNQQRNDDSVHIILAGRNPKKGQQAVNEVLESCATTAKSTKRGMAVCGGCLGALSSPTIG